jgi:microcystin-dependent protein
MNFLNKMNFTYVIIIVIIIMASIHLYKLKRSENFEDIAISDNQIIGSSVQILIPSMNQVKFGGSGLDTILDDKVSQSDLEVVTDAINNAMPELSIVAYSSSRAPTGWQVCNGLPLKYKTGESVNDDEEERFIGMNKEGSTIKTPDLRGRFILGSGQGVGLSTDRVIHTMGGEEAHTLTVNEIPDHHHITFGNDVGGDYGSGTFEGTTSQGSQGAPQKQSGYNTGDMISKQDTVINPKEMPHNNMPPFYILTYIIKKPTKLLI